MGSTRSQTALVRTENSEAISKVYIKSKDQLRAAFSSKILKRASPILTNYLLTPVLLENKLEGLDWRLDYILSSSQLHVCFDRP